MHISFAYRVVVLAAVSAVCAPVAHAQWSAGVTGGAFSWEDGRREQAAGVVVQLQPVPWLLLGAVPAVLRADDGSGGDARMGFADLPVYAALVHREPGASRLTIGATASMSFPTGDERSGLGRGSTALNGELSMAVDPVAGLTVRGGASRLLRVGGDAPIGVPTTALYGDAVLGSDSPTNVSLGIATELRGDAPAAYETARAISASLAHTLPSGSTLILGGAHALAGSGPDWSVSIGFGTAFGGVAPVGATSPLQRAGSLPRAGSGGLASALCGLVHC